MTNSYNNYLKTAITTMTIYAPIALAIMVVAIVMVYEPSRTRSLQDTYLFLDEVAFMLAKSRRNNNGAYLSDQEASQRYFKGSFAADLLKDTYTSHEYGLLDRELFMGEGKERNLRGEGYVIRSHRFIARVLNSTTLGRHISTVAPLCRHSQYITNGDGDLPHLFYRLVWTVNCITPSHGDACYIDKHDYEYRYQDALPAIQCYLTNFFIRWIEIVGIGVKTAYVFEAINGQDCVRFECNAWTTWMNKEYQRIRTAQVYRNNLYKNASDQEVETEFAKLNDTEKADLKRHCDTYGPTPAETVRKCAMYHVLTSGLNATQMAIDVEYLDFLESRNNALMKDHTFHVINTAWDRYLRLGNYKGLR